MSSPLAQTVYLIASGRTQWQEDGRVQGNTDLPLTAEALRAVSEAAAGFHPPQKPRTIYASPDEASRQTAEAFAQRLGEVRVKPIEVLEEMNLGLWQGVTQKQAAERYVRSFGQWLEDPSLVSPPSGESLEAAADRLVAAVSKLMRKAGDAPLVLVLRPLALNICAAWLRGEPVGQRLFDTDHPTIQSLRLSADETKSIAAARRRKPLRVAPTR